MDKKQLQSILSTGYQPAFWRQVLTDVFGVTRLNQQPQPIILPANDLAEAAFELGSFETTDERLVGLYRIDLKPNVRIGQNRVGLRSLLRNIYKYDVDAALVVFVQDDKWRLSLISEIRILDDNGDPAEQKTEPKRFTYLLGVDETVRTATDRLLPLGEQSFTLDKLIDAFSVEKLTKAFFKRYKELFGEFCEHLTASTQYRELFLNSKQKPKDGWKDLSAKPIRDFTKILLGRLVFLQFLQKKGWMGVPANETAWENGDARFLQTLFARTKDKDHFHSGALRTLFFETLNSKRKGDLADTLLGLNIRIPYLNGGLFDTDISTRNAVDFPKELFAELIDFFEQYNFTIDEDDPYDREVGIDPEMLGHIFENLLEENREKGAFYTPKEIVHYMCQESLIEYLATHLPNDDRPGIERLVRDNQIAENFTDRAKAIEINRLLRDVKICDPAIGSGAFPMGLLKEIFECRRLVYPYLRTNESFNPATIKKEIIQNNIYGVDIDNGAVEIARLRFWLALVVDEIVPAPLPNLDYKIMQGNSLLEQFEDISLVFDKSQLSPDYYVERNLFGDAVNAQTSLMDVLRVQQELGEFDVTKLESEFFGTEDAEQKAHIREQLNRLERLVIEQAIKAKESSIRSDIANIKADITRKQAAVRVEQRDKIIPLSTFKKLSKLDDQLEDIGKSKERLQALRPDNKPYFLWHLYFQDVFERGGFDIVIANPPYIKEYTDRKAFDGLRDSQYYKGKMDIWYFFACFCLDLLKHGGIQCFIAQNNWITSAGASILREQVLQRTEISIFTDFGDYKVFESAGIQTMIYQLKNLLPKDFYETRYGRLRNSQIDKGNLQRFLRADSLESNEHYIKFPHLTEPRAYADGFIYFNESVNADLLSKIREADKVDFLLESEIAQGIVAPQDKLNQKNQAKLGANYVVGEGIFQLSTQEKRRLSLSILEKELVKPFFSTTELGKYYGKSSSNEWIIYTKSNIAQSIKKYPNIKAHLDRFKKVNTSTFAPYGLHRARDEKFFFGTKIMCVRKCEHPTFTYTDFDCYVSQTFFVIKTERFDNKFLTGLLNSKLIEFWLRHRGKLQGNLFQIDKEPLLDIPIRKEDSIGAQIAEKVDDIINAKKQDPNMDTSILEDAVDYLVYELYGLDEDEIREIEIWYLYQYPNQSAGDFAQRIREKYKDYIARLELLRSKPREFWESHPTLGIIARGESSKLEFKETLEANNQTGDKHPGLVLSVLKTIAAFLNTDGGTLLIGVADSGGIKGLELDLKLCRKPNIDSFELKIQDLIKDRLKAAVGKVNVSFEHLPEGDVCKIEVEPSPGITFVDGKDVYVRVGNRTEKPEGARLAEWIQGRSAA